MNNISNDELNSVIDCADEINYYLTNRGYVDKYNKNNENTIVVWESMYDKTAGVFPLTFKFDKIQNCKLQNKPSSISVIGYQYRNMSSKMLIRMCYYMYEHILPFLDKYEIKDEYVKFNFEDIAYGYTLSYLKKQPTFSKGQLILDK